LVPADGRARFHPWLNSSFAIRFPRFRGFGTELAGRFANGGEVFPVCFEMSRKINAKSCLIRKASAVSSRCVVYALLANEPKGPHTSFAGDCGDYFFATFIHCTDNPVKK